MSLDGILDLEIVEGAINAEIFESFVERLVEQMNPHPLPNSVLVMDNAKFHRPDWLKAICGAK